MQLDGTVSLVTGGAGGLGRQIALTLAKAGSKVAILDIQQTGGEAVEKELQGISDGKFFNCDMTKVANINQGSSGGQTAFWKNRYPGKLRGIGQPGAHRRGNRGAMGFSDQCQSKSRVFYLPGSGQSNEGKQRRKDRQHVIHTSTCIRRPSHNLRCYQGRHRSDHQKLCDGICQRQYQRKCCCTWLGTHWHGGRKSDQEGVS